MRRLPTDLGTIYQEMAKKDTAADIPLRNNPETQPLKLQRKPEIDNSVELFPRNEILKRMSGCVALTNTSLHY